MSIRGIDAQIMINRSAELSRDAASQNRNLVNFQSYLGDSEHKRVQQNANRVNSSNKSEFNRVNADGERERQGQNARSGGHGHETQENDDFIASYDDESTIDIRI